MDKYTALGKFKNKIILTKFNKRLFRKQIKIEGIKIFFRTPLISGIQYETQIGVAFKTSIVEFFLLSV